MIFNRDGWIILYNIAIVFLITTGSIFSGELFTSGIFGMMFIGLLFLMKEYGFQKDDQTRKLNDTLDTLLWAHEQGIITAENYDTYRKRILKETAKEVK